MLPSAAQLQAQARATAAHVAAEARAQQARLAQQARIQHANAAAASHQAAVKLAAANATAARNAKAASQRAAVAAKAQKAKEAAAAKRATAQAAQQAKVNKAAAAKAAKAQAIADARAAQIASDNSLIITPLNSNLATPGATAGTTATPSASDPYGGLSAASASSPDSTGAGATGFKLTTTEWVLVGVGGVALIGGLVVYAKVHAVTAPIRHAHRIYKAVTG